MTEQRHRTVLITGASAGLGESIALACANRGWRLALGARRVDRVEDVARRAREAGAEVYAVCSACHVAYALETIPPSELPGN